MFLFSIHTRALSAEAPEFVLRAEMVAFSVIGIILLAAAVYELAGPRPDRRLDPGPRAGQHLLLEPPPQGPLMYLAEGLVVFGGALLWKRGKMVALVPMVLGCLIAMATRPYAGWFLTAAAAAVVLHASLTRQRGLARSPSPRRASFSSDWPCPWFGTRRQTKSWSNCGSLRTPTSPMAQTSRSSGSTIPRENLILNLPKRVRDVIFRPYLWQTQNPSQQLGALGTVVVLACLALLAAAIARNRRSIMQRPGPWCTRPRSCWWPTRSARVMLAPRTAIARTSSLWRCA